MTMLLEDGSLKSSIYQTSRSGVTEEGERRFELALVDGLFE
jgi:hypothetical protein